MKWQTRFPERILLRGYHYYLSDSVKDLMTRPLTVEMPY